MAGLWGKVKRSLYRQPGLFYALPAEYLLRLIAVGLVLTGTGRWGNPITVAAVAGTTWGAALVSLGFGLTLGAITVARFLTRRQRSWRQLVAGVRARPGHAMYILFWVSGIGVTPQK